MKKIKFQTERIVIPLGFSSVKEVPVQMDSAYEKVTGYTVHPVIQASADKFDLGLVDRTGVLHDRTFQNDHIADTSVPMKDRYKDLIAKANGNQINIQIEPVAALTAELTVDVVFRLESDHNC